MTDKTPTLYVVDSYATTEERTGVKVVLEFRPKTSIKKRTGSVDLEEVYRQILSEIVKAAHYRDLNQIQHIRDSLDALSGYLLERTGT